MTHELDGMAKYRRAATKAAAIRAEQDAADQLRAAAALAARPAPAAADPNAALIAAVSRAEANGAFKREPVAAAPVAKPITAAVPQAAAATVCGIPVPAIRPGMTREQYRAALPAEIKAVTGFITAAMQHYDRNK